MKKKNLIQELQDRSLIQQITDKKIITSLLNKPIYLYCGFDPTYDSLHLGHLIPLICLKRFQMFGHTPIILLGEATAIIGDPSFRYTERSFNNIKNIKIYTKKIIKQISLILDFKAKNKAIFVNNLEWFDSVNILKFLCEIGKYFSIHNMIKKKFIQNRLNSENNKLSFTEFSYNLLQSYDFSMLNKIYNVKLQIGGSDQWGNIISGISLIKKKYKKQVFGLTLPIMTSADGNKISKSNKFSEKIWLDPKKTSPYKFYQFWINTKDSDVYQFLKIFTFLDITDINNLKIKDQNNNNLKPNAQYILATSITKLIHGVEGLLIAQRITNSLFKNKICDLIEEDFLQLLQDGLDNIKISGQISLQKILVLTSLASSNQKSQNMISSQAIRINGKVQTEKNYILQKSDKLFEKYTIICRGKKNHYLIHWI